MADNYNSVLSRAKEALPNIDYRRWPPVAEKTNPAMGYAHAEQSHGEFAVYCEQIKVILQGAMEDVPTMIMRG